MGGVVYQTHRHTVISKLKGQLQYEVRSNRCRCSNRISRTWYAFLLSAVQVLGLLFLLTTPTAMDTFMARAVASDEAGGVREMREGMAAAATGRERLPVLLKCARIALQVC